MNQNKYHSNTTFTKTPVLPQIISYLVFTLQTVLFYSVVVPNFQSQSSKIAFSIVYSATLLVIFFSGVISSSCDPSDPIMIKNRNCSSQQYIINDIDLKSLGRFIRAHFYTVSIAIVWCIKNLDIVKSAIAEHSCVINFDHHCMWINNCIGELNYKPFFVMIISAFSNLLVYVIAVISLTVQHRFQNYFGGFIAAWISGVINFIFVVLLANLIILHIYLICKGISTYQFVMAQRQQEHKQKEQTAAIQTSKKQDKKQNVHQQFSQQYFKKQIQMLPSKQISNTNIIQVKNKQSQSNSQQNEQSAKYDSLKDKKYIKSMLFKQKQQSQKSVRVNLNQKEPSKHKFDQNDDCDEESSVQISQLFTRNKSLKLIIGKTESSRPQRAKKYAHHSLIVGERSNKQDTIKDTKTNKK